MYCKIMYYILKYINNDDDGDNSNITIIYLFISFSGSAAQRGLWPPRSRGFLITNNDAPQSVRTPLDE
jgi:hypothetical protein